MRLLPQVVSTLNQASPWQAVAMIRGGASDATLRVELRDAEGLTVGQDELTVTSTAKGLGHTVAQSLGLTAAEMGQIAYAVIAVPSDSPGWAIVNFGGTPEGSDGAGNGVRTGAAPTSSSPLRLLPGETWEVGR